MTDLTPEWIQTMTDMAAQNPMDVLRLIDHQMAAAAEGLLPNHMHEPLARYYLLGIGPGDFMLAVLKNQLIESYMRADMVNLRDMAKWATFMYNHMPRVARNENVEQWIVGGGYIGRMSKILSENTT